MDGNYLDNPSFVGFESLSKDKWGRWLASFLCFLGMAFTMNAKVKAILFALKFAKDKGYDKIVIEIDSQDVCDVVCIGFLIAIFIRGTFMILLAFPQLLRK